MARQCLADFAHECLRAVHLISPLSLSHTPHPHPHPHPNTGDVDHLERRELEKKLRVVHNKTNQAANLERAALEGERSKGFSSNNALFSSTSAEAAKGSKKRRKEGSGGVAAALAKPWGGSSSSSSAQAEGSGGARLPAGIPSIPIAEGRADVLAGPGKHARPRPSDTKGVKTAQIGMAQVSTASMGKVSRGSSRQDAAMQPSSQHACHARTHACTHTLHHPLSPHLHSV